MAESGRYAKDDSSLQRKCSHPNCRFHLGGRTAASSSGLPEHLTRVINDGHDVDLEETMYTDCAHSPTMASLAEESTLGEKSTVETEQSNVTAATSQDMSGSEQEKDDQDKENKAEDGKGYEGDDEDHEVDPDKMDISEMDDMSLDDVLHLFLEVIGEIMEATDQILAKEEVTGIGTDN